MYPFLIHPFAAKHPCIHGKLCVLRKQGGSVSARAGGGLHGTRQSARGHHRREAQPRHPVQPRERRDPNGLVVLPSPMIVRVVVGGGVVGTSNSSSSIFVKSLRGRIHPVGCVCLPNFGCTGMNSPSGEIQLPSFYASSTLETILFMPHVFEQGLSFLK